MRLCAVGVCPAVLLTLLAVISLAGCGGDTTTIVKTVTAETEPAPESKPVSEPSDPRAGIGDLLTLAASDATLKIRLGRVIDPLPVGTYDSAKNGHRFVGIELAVKNTGPNAYSDSLSNGSAIILRDGTQADPTLVSGGPCGNDFGVDVKIAADDKRVGCIAFEVPESKRLRSFQFTPASGFGEETGEWELSRGTRSRLTSAPTSESDEIGPPPEPAAERGAAPAGQWMSCDANISAQTPGTTCEFASNLFYEYWSGGQVPSVSAYSPASGTFDAASCIPSGETIRCSSPDGASVRFSQSALDAYSQSQADRYAATHEVGH